MKWLERVSTAVVLVLTLLPSQPVFGQEHRPRLEQSSMFQLRADMGPTGSPTTVADVVIGGLIGGGLGLLAGALGGAGLGAVVDASDCEDCTLAGAAVGAFVGEAVGVAVGGHLGGDGRGRLGVMSIVSLGIGVAGGLVVSQVEAQWARGAVLPLVLPIQLYAVVRLELR
jgi:hypothetical protein